MPLPTIPESSYLMRMADGTIKQVNPFTGTEVWTVPGRGNRPIGSGARAQWLPWPGRHVVQLRDAQGRVHDERRIQVRGAVAKTAPPRKPP